MWEAGPEDHVDLMSDSLPKKAEKWSTGVPEKKSHCSIQGTIPSAGWHQQSVEMKKKKKPPRKAPNETHRASVSAQDGLPVFVPVFDTLSISLMCQPQVGHQESSTSAVQC